MGQTAENSRQVRKNRLGPSAGRWHIRPRKKGGTFVGKTKCGKGSKIMTLIDGSGTPLAVDLHSASPAEVTLIEPLLRKRLLRRPPRRLVYDRAADSDPLRERLRRRRIDLICPHRGNRCRPATQDGRKLRRYRKRWKVERSISWLHNFRRLVVRYEYHAHLFLGFVHAACLLIALRKLPLKRTLALYTTK
jgi:transposase